MRKALKAVRRRFYTSLCDESECRTGNSLEKLQMPYIDRGGMFFLNVFLKIG
jgi:hypothetical protein